MMQTRHVGDWAPHSRPDPEACNDLCKELPGGLVPARDDNSTWVKTVVLTEERDLTVKLCSRSEAYEDLDDMCVGCKRREKVD